MLKVKLIKYHDVMSVEQTDTDWYVQDFIRKDNNDHSSFSGLRCHAKRVNGQGIELVTGESVWYTLHVCMFLTKCMISVTPYSRMPALLNVVHAAFKDIKTCHDKM
jgi:hypothetical protein